jgi:hypothetical protein
VLQNRILKNLFNKDWFTNTNELHKELNVLKVDDIVKLFVLKFVHNCKSGYVPEVFKNYYIKRSVIHNRNTRNHDNYDIPLCKTFMYGQTSIKYIGTNLYNELPKHIKEIKSHKRFNIEVKKLLMEHYH